MLQGREAFPFSVGGLIVQWLFGAHLPRSPGGEVLDDYAVVGLPAGRVASPDGAAAAPAARGRPAEAATLAAASSLAGQLHADSVGENIHFSALLYKKLLKNSTRHQAILLSIMLIL